jgi:hypothetical protein
VDDCTFWYTQEYIQTTGSRTWQTRVASFRFPNCTTTPTGILSGTVTDAGTLAPISGTTISVTNGATVTLSTLSHVDGSYELVLPVSTYTVTASAFGYTTSVVTGVQVLSGTLTTQDFALGRLPEVVLDGVVDDSLTGWPLYASLSFAGLPLDPIWSDPGTGYYSLTVPTGISFTLDVQAFVAGYQVSYQPVGPLYSDTTQDLHLVADPLTCQAPGYLGGGLSQDFGGAFPPTGWQVLDNAGNGVIWKSCSDWSEGNYTGGAGGCAGASSDHAGLLEYDTELRSPLIDVADLATTTLQYRANYQNLSNLDYLDLDVSTNGGIDWTNILSWNEDHGAFRATPGQLVSVDLAP